jgi:hypothetical protein
LEDLQHKSEVIRELEAQNRELQENLRVIEIQHLQERRRLKEGVSTPAPSLSIDVPDDGTEQHDEPQESERTEELEQELESLQARVCLFMFCITEVV